MQYATRHMNMKSFFEWIVIGCSLGSGIIFAWYIQNLRMTTSLMDQNAHLNIARQIIDSLTPGITQLGFWPPMLHILMIPATANSWLYSTGLAGAVTVIPLFVLAAFFLYRLIHIFTESPWISFMGSLFFILNPYVLYYAVTPMTEIPFLAFLFGTAYFFSRWLHEKRFFYLTVTAIFIVLASLTRFEGFILIPLIGGFVLLSLFRERKKYHEIEAVFILFGSIAVLGLVAVFAYSWFFGGDALAFLSSRWSAFAQQQDYERPAEGSFIKSLQYMVHASYYMFGRPQTVVAFLAFLAIMVLAPMRYIFIVTIILVSPFIFNLISLYFGNTVIYIDELPPTNWFFNERYGLYWIGFAVFAPFAIAGIANKSAKRMLPEKLLIGAFLLPLVTIQAAYLGEIAFVDQYRIIRKAAEKYDIQIENQKNSADILRENYDYGKIFMTRATNDLIPLHAGIPIRNYIYESNYRFYDQALERPWLFARWVVMLNVNNLNDPYLLDWVKNNEEVSKRWGNSEVFATYYTLVGENKFHQVYLLKEDSVRRYARARNLDSDKIPSLNPEIERWNPETVYTDMKFAGSDKSDKISPLGSLFAFTSSFFEQWTR